jgi:hypothetical protein
MNVKVSGSYRLPPGFRELKPSSCSSVSKLHIPLRKTLKWETNVITRILLRLSLLLEKQSTEVDLFDRNQTRI